MKASKIYVVSGLGADFTVLEKIKFPKGLKVEYIAWKMPEANEAFSHYVLRMAESIEKAEPFYLLGYSFGGLVVQEIHRNFPAEKVIVLGSVCSASERSTLWKSGAATHWYRFVPSTFLSKESRMFKIVLDRFFGDSRKVIKDYFKVEDPDYLKWSLKQITEWKGEKSPRTVQISGERDRIFPLKYSSPNYVIKKGTHLFPMTHSREVSEILEKELDVESH